MEELTELKEMTELMELKELTEMTYMPDSAELTAEKTYKSFSIVGFFKSKIISLALLLSK